MKLIRVVSLLIPLLCASTPLVGKGSLSLFGAGLIRFPIVDIPGTELAPLPLQAALEARSFLEQTPLSISPDGLWVAYSLHDPRRRELIQDERYRRFTRSGVPTNWAYSDVWVTDIRTGEAKNVTGDQYSNWAPAWSPNGKLLAFYSDRSGETCLWIWERATGSLRQVATASVRTFFGFEGPRWTPDGRRVLVKLLPIGMTVEQANALSAEEAPREGRSGSKNPGVTVLIYSASRSGEPAAASSENAPVIDSWTNLELADLALIDIQTGTVERIAPGVKARGYWISPDGRHIAFTTIAGRKDQGSAAIIYDLVLYGISDHQSRIVSKLTTPYGLTVSWSPDSQRLAFTSSAVPLADKAQKIGECFVASVVSGDFRPCTRTTHPDFGSDFRPPLWDRTGTFLYFVADRAVWQINLINQDARRITKDLGVVPIELVASDGGSRAINPTPDSLLLRVIKPGTSQGGFYRLDVQSGAATELILEDRRYGAGPFLLDATADGQTIIYTSQDAGHSEDIWIADAAFKHPRRLTSINPQFDQYVMGRSQRIEYRTNDGQLLHGALLLPADYEEGKRYPLLVVLYDGLHSGNFNDFGLYGRAIENMQLFATRGYAVLYPDMPLRVGTPMRDIAQTVLPAVNKVIDSGIADPARLGVTGHSYGGYATLAVIVQTKRFKAAVARASIGNLIGVYGEMNTGGYPFGISWAESGQGRMGGTPWQVRQQYIENSPVFYLDRVETPLLLVHGAADGDVAPFLADEVFVGLRRLGKEVVYAKYAGEGHAEGYWSNANVADEFERVIAWWDEHLKN